MHATRNSKPLPNSRSKPPAKRTPKRRDPKPRAIADDHRWWEYLVIASLLLAIGAAAAWWFHKAGFVLYYGDAEAHLAVARRIVDSRTPGYEQIGTVWLPLPHALMVPFVKAMSSWQSGMAATIPGVACFVLGGLMLYGAARTAYASAAAAVSAVLLFALNPNLLYLQSTAMSEHIFFAMQLGLLFCTVRFAHTQSSGYVVIAGLFATLTTMTRYDGWFLLPFACIFVFIAAKEDRLRAAIVFTIFASLGPLYWFAHNAYFYSNALEFYNGPYSAKAIQGTATYPGSHDLSKAFQYYQAAATLCVGVPLLILGLAGAFAAMLKRAFWPLLLLALAPVFYVVSMYWSGHTPIFVPNLWPNTYYNTRYGLAVLPLAAFAAAGLVALLPHRFRPAALVGTVIIAVAPWIAYPRAESWITWKESQVNSQARRAWTRQAADYLGEHYRPGSGILFSMGDLVGVFREAGIPLRETLHQGNGPLATAVLNRPDLFMREEWAIAITGDPVSDAMLKLVRTGSPYTIVHTIRVKDAPPIEIHRRIRPMPKL